MKKLAVVIASVLMFATVGFCGVAANAATVERTISPFWHMVYSWTELPGALDVHNEWVKTILLNHDDVVDTMLAKHDICSWDD